MGEHVIYVDEHGQSHPALVTQVWDGGEGSLANHSSVNLLWVSADETKRDQYGRQVERNTSVVHESMQSANGRYWKETT